MKTVSFVIPVYNEAARISRTFTALLHFTPPEGIKLHEVLFVDDGSTDNTADLIRLIKPQLTKRLKAKVKLFSYPQNQGKGAAVVTGMHESTADYSIFMDADMSTPLSQLDKCLPYINQGVDIIVGTRKNTHSTVIIHQPRYRELLGRGFTLLSNVALNTWVTDFTCGFKIVSRSAKNAIFPRIFSKRWTFDAELLFIARKLGFTIHEVAVAWSDNQGSKVHLVQDVIGTLRELALIRPNFWRSGGKSLIPHPDVLVISSYPQPGQTHGTGTVGVASFTKNTLQALYKAEPKKQIMVLAERLAEEKESSYVENGITIKRLWKRNHPFLFLRLIDEIYSNRTTPTVLIEFELAMFGNILHLSVFPLFLGLLWLMRKKVIIVFHQVVGDLQTIAPHVGLQPNSLRTTLINFGLNIFYHFTCFFASEIVVFDAFLREALALFTTKRKIVVIPHGVETFANVPSHVKIRQQLGIAPDEFVLLYFGFIAWYKGTDMLAKLVAQLPEKIQGKRIKLIIAGGVNPNHQNKKYYQRFMYGIKQYAAHHSRIEVTGFIPEDMIANYFSAADVVMLPYRTAMSASGPLSLAFSFHKPFLISPQLAEIVQTVDMLETMNSLQLTPQDLVVTLTPEALSQKIGQLIANPQLPKTLTAFSAALHQRRDFEKIGIAYAQLVYENQQMAALPLSHRIGRQYRYYKLYA